MQAVALLRTTRCAAETLRNRTTARCFASKNFRDPNQAWPRLAVERQIELPRDPETLVRSVHEKERNAFREALNSRDFTTAYQIYEEQRGLPILSGAEVTSLVQLISADALLRKQNKYEFPEILQEVFWTIIDDVKEHKVSGQTMLWAHALDVLVTWNKLQEAEELWKFLQELPNRVSVDKNDAHCIDSRVYGSAIKLYTALNDMPTVEKLYQEALTDRGLMPSLMLDQALISALFQNGRVGEAYKTMDRAIREQRRALRPGFFNSMIFLAMDANAIGVATEIFMKACKINMPPSNIAVTRLLSGLARTSSDPLKSVLTLFKHFRNFSAGTIPVEHVNCVIDAMFASVHDEVPKSEVLTRVHHLLSEMRGGGLQSNISTINILLKGYTLLEEYSLVDDLIARGRLNENSFRAILKALAQLKSTSAFNRVQQYWKIFEDHLQRSSKSANSRDYQMLMRAAFATNTEAAREWIPEWLGERAAGLDTEAQTTLQNELQCHLDGTFVHTTRRYDQSGRRAL